MTHITLEGSGGRSAVKELPDSNETPRRKGTHRRFAESAASPQQHVNDTNVRRAPEIPDSAAACSTGRCSKTRHSAPPYRFGSNKTQRKYPPMKSPMRTYPVRPRHSLSESKPLEPLKIYEQEIFLEPRLLELVRLRVAQICDCKLCIDHHTETLKAQGESRERLEKLKTWRESALYNNRERTALAVGEALGSDPPKPLAKDVVFDARAYFNDAEILQLTLTIFAVNDWNHLCAH